MINQCLCSHCTEIKNQQTRAFQLNKIACNKPLQTVKNKLIY